jgi:hypothetical protein
MHDDQGESAAWQPCPRGTLADLAGRLRGRRRQRILARLAVAPLVLAAGAAVTMIVIGKNSPEPNPQGRSLTIKCKECRQLLPQYVAHSLPPDQMERMRVHLAKCRPCREVMEQMRSSVAWFEHECQGTECPLCRQRQMVDNGVLALGAGPHDWQFYLARLHRARDPQ